MRIFLAVRIPSTPELKSLLQRFRSVLKDERIKWVEPDNVHITVAFLGEKDERERSAVIRVTRNITREHELFPLEPVCPGVFRNVRDARVIWIGIKEPGRLEKLQSEIAAQLEEEGLYLQDKPFRAHITLGRVKGRIKSRENLLRVLDEFESKSLPAIRVEEIILYRSILRQKGPLYVALERFPLKKM